MAIRQLSWRSADQGYRKRLQAPPRTTGAPRFAYGSGKLGQDLGKIRAKVENRAFKHSFAKQGLASFSAARGGSASSPQHAPDGEEFLAPLAANRLPIEARKLLERMRDGFPGRGDGRRRITVGTPRRLRHDLIDDSEAHHIIGGDLQAGRRLLRLRCVAPQDRSRAPPADHSVEPMV